MILNLPEKKREFEEALVEWDEAVRFMKKCSLWTWTATLVAIAVQLYTLTFILGGICIGGMVYLIRCLRQYNKCINGLDIIHSFETKPEWMAVLNTINEVDNELHKENR